MANHLTSKRVLVAPLDWGLGHATRCIPVINELQKQGAIVFIASSGDALLLLKEEFPELVFFEITSYQVHYSRTLPFMVSMLFQLPKFMNAVRKERKEMEQIVADHQINVIISDNRFGCGVKGITSVFMTHQVTILMPWWLRWAAPLINSFNHRQIKNFDQCWVPDESTHRLTCRLTEAGKLKLKFIGMLSRFKKLEVTKKYDLLILISGPEPQRTVMEEVIVPQVAALKQKVLIVRGLPGSNRAALSVSDNVVVSDYLNASELNVAIEESELVICRSGYSTIMDLIRLNKKAIFIPTHGQTEQEYLAHVLSENKIAFCTTLDKLNVVEAIKLSSGFPGFTISHDNHLLPAAIKEVLL